MSNLERMTGGVQLEGGISMIDRYTKVILTVIAVNLTLTVADSFLRKVIPEAWAQGIVDVHVVGGRLDYETDVSGGPTLKVCTQC
jgi:hypothetical protein